MKNVFIIGSRGYTKNYGGWETFVHGLLDNWKDDTVNFIVFEISNNIEDDNKIEVVNGFTCITLYIPSSGSSSMMKFDLKATKFAYRYVLENKIEKPIFFYLGLRIGPYVWLKKRKLKKAGIKLIENPAGIEWKRTKWNKLVQIYAYFAAKMMASSVDYLVCDNGGVLEVYNRFRCCRKTKKTVIPYGTYPGRENDCIMPKEVTDFYTKYGISPKKYYLILGRLVPENNYDLMLYEISKYKGQNKFLVICNIDKEKKYYSKLDKKFQIHSNSNVIFAGELYDQCILSYIRQNALAYIHGHSVGGTNPGLLEAMSNTDINVLFDCPFNKEVGKDTALYFDKKRNSLNSVLDEVEKMKDDEVANYGHRAKQNMLLNYSWELIVGKYSFLFDKIC